MTLKLAEDPQVTPYGNTLYIEPLQGLPGSTFIVMCSSDENPANEGSELRLTREQSIMLRDYLNEILTG